MPTCVLPDSALRLAVRHRLDAAAAARVKNVSDCVAYEWFSGMAIPSSLKSAASGAVTLETAECVAIGDNEPRAYCSGRIGIRG